MTTSQFTLLVLLVPLTLGGVLYGSSNATDTLFNAYLTGPSYCQGSHSEFSLSNASVVSISEFTSDACDFSALPTSADILALSTEQVTCLMAGTRSMTEFASDAGFKAVVLYETTYIESGGVGGSARYYWFACGGPIPVFIVSADAGVSSALSESNGYGIMDIDVTSNPYDSWVYLTFSVGLRCAILVGLAIFRLYIAYRLTVQRKAERVGLSVSSWVIGLEVAACLLMLSVAGDAQYSSSIMPFDVYTILTNLVVLLPNLSTALVAIAFLDALVEAMIIKSAAWLRRFIVALSILIPAVQILATLGNAKVVEAPAMIGEINALIVLLFNLFVSVVFFKYKAKTMAAMGSSTVNYKILKMSTMMKISAYLAIASVIAYVSVVVVMLFGNYDGLSWSLFFVSLAGSLMGVVQLLSLRGSEKAGFKTVIDVLVRHADQEGRALLDRRVPTGKMTVDNLEATAV